MGKLPIYFFISLLLLSLAYAECTDTDSGKSFFTYGEVTDSTTSEVDYCRDDQYLMEYYCRDGRVSLEGFNCVEGCEEGRCLLPDPQVKEDCLANEENYWEEIHAACRHGYNHIKRSSACTDADGGVDYSERSYAFGFMDRYEKREDKRVRMYRTDGCEGDSVVEYYCFQGRLKNVKEECTYGCKDGFCLEEPATASFYLAVDEESTPEDIVTITEAGVFLAGNSGIKSISKLNDEIDVRMVAETVTLFVFEGSAVIIVGKRANQNAVDAVGTLYDFLDRERDIIPDIIQSEEVTDDDLKKALGDYEETNFVATKKTVELPEKEVISEVEEIVQEEVECDGCLTDDGCLKEGTIVGSAYCTNGKIQDRLTIGSYCQHNYECSIGICYENKCGEPNVFQKVMNWFRDLFA